MDASWLGRNSRTKRLTEQQTSSSVVTSPDRGLEDSFGRYLDLSDRPAATQDDRTSRRTAVAWGAVAPSDLVAVATGGGLPPTGTRPRRRPTLRHRPVLAATALAVVLAMALGYLTMRRSTATSDPHDPGLVHVHGLGVNPADNRLYAATHTGLFRVEKDGSARRIADRYQDTMGFSVTGPNRFLASGHPDIRDTALRQTDRPPLLGLVESSDAGRRWRPRSLLGEADLHTLAVVDGLIVAYDSTGRRVLASTDGRAWETRSSIALLDLAVAPSDPTRMIALSAAGKTLQSSDGGRSWTSQPDGPVLQVLRWARSGLWGGSEDGTLARYDDASRTWTAAGRLAGPVEALLVEDRTVYAAVAGSGIYRSDDSASTWSPVYRPRTVSSTLG